MHPILSIHSKAQKKALGAIAATYAAGTNHIEFAENVRFVTLDLTASAAAYLYMLASLETVTDPATDLADAGLRYRFTVKTKANGGTYVQLAFDAPVKHLYFLTDAGTVDAAILGYAK